MAVDGRVGCLMPDEASNTEDARRIWNRVGKGDLQLVLEGGQR